MTFKQQKSAACAAPIVMWHHLPASVWSWSDNPSNSWSSKGAALNANNNWNPSPISNSFGPGLLKVSPQQQKTWHSQELCHHHLPQRWRSTQRTNAECPKPSFACILVPFQALPLPSNKAFDKIRTQQSSNSLTKGVRWIFRMPQVWPLQSWRKKDCHGKTSAYVCIWWLVGQTSMFKGHLWGWTSRHLWKVRSVVA